MSVELAGSIGIPSEKPILSRPEKAAAVAGGFLETVLVDLTKPIEKEFWVRIYDDHVTPPKAEVVTVYIIYGLEIQKVVRSLEAAWKKAHLEPTRSFEDQALYCYEHQGGWVDVVRAIEALQREFPPQ